MLSLYFLVIVLVGVGPAQVESLVPTPAASKVGSYCRTALQTCTRPFRVRVSSLSIDAQRQKAVTVRGGERKQVVQLLYFVIFSALACQGRFLSLFFRDSLGLSNQQIGA